MLLKTLQPKSWISLQSCVKVGRACALACQQGLISLTYIVCEHWGGQGRRVPLSSAANSCCWSWSFMQSGKRGSSPRENISYNVTPYDHTSERGENFPSRRLSGAYLQEVNR